MLMRPFVTLNVRKYASVQGTLEITAPAHEDAVADLDRCKGAVESFARVQREGVLLTVEFTTVIEYLFYLRAVAFAVAPLEKKSALFLAAAVSDFYVRAEDACIGLND